MMAKLSDSEIAQKLRELDGWAREGDFIQKKFALGDFQEALAFIVRVGFVAEEHGHHPDLYNVYKHVTLKFTTHDAGGLTDKDFAIARAIDGLDA